MFNLSIINTILLPLAADPTKQSNIMRSFEAIRRTCISASGTFVSLALALSALLVAIKLIHISYEVMSDEQGAGFGSVSLKLLLRPVYMVILIAGFPIFIAGLDGLTNLITDRIVVTATAKKEANTELAKAILGMSEYEEKIENEYVMPEQFGSFLESQRDDYNTPGAQATKGRGQIRRETFRELKTSENVQKAIDEAGESSGDLLKQYRKAVREYFNAYNRTYGSNGDVIADEENGMFAKICKFMFDNLYVIMQAFAELALCLFAMLGPFVFAFSLLDVWQGAAKGFIGKYIELSFWKVSASLIDWVVNISMQVTTSNAYNAAEQAMAYIYNTGIADNTYVSIKAAVTTSALISIAGIMALMNVPELTNTVLGLGQNAMAGAKTGAGLLGGLMNAPGKGLSAGTNVATKAVFANKFMGKGKK